MIKVGIPFSGSRKGWAFFRLDSASPSRSRVIVVGDLWLDRLDLAEFDRRGQHYVITVVGRLRLTDDVPPALADELFDRVRVIGSVRMSDAVRHRLGSKLAA